METIDFFFFFFSLNSDIITALKKEDWNMVTSTEISRMCQGGDCKLVAHD